MRTRTGVKADAGPRPIVRALSAGAMIAAMAAAAPSKADYYIKGSLAGNLMLESNVEGTNVTNGRMRYQVGATGSAALGMEAGPFRFEIEGSYGTSPGRQFDATSFSSTGGTFNNLSDQDVDGDIRLATGMINGFVEIPIDRVRVTPYIGLGGGLAYVDAHDLQVVIGGAGLPLSDDGDILIAYQAEAGFAYAFNPRMVMEFAYRFFGTLQDAEFQDSLGDTISMDIHQHRLRLALKYYL